MQILFIKKVNFSFLNIKKNQKQKKIVKMY